MVKEPENLGSKHFSSKILKNEMAIFYSGISKMKMLHLSRSFDPGTKLLFVISVF